MNVNGTYEKKNQKKGTICQAPLACGASCGSSDQCASSCPVCNRIAQCAQSWEVEGITDEEGMRNQLAVRMAALAAVRRPAEIID